MSKFFTIKQKIGLGVVAVLLALTVVAWQEVFKITGPHYLKIDVLDIGQGDSIFIETPAMRRILIDGGPGAKVLQKLAERLPFWEKHFDMVILTHPDADHLVGLLSVLQKYQVDYIVWTGIVRDGAAYQEWLELLEKQKARGAKIIIASLHTNIGSGGVVFDTLHPFENLEGQDFSKAGNDTGIVLRAAYGQKSFLFTGDISSKVEQEMIEENIPVAADVLKVPHHGSKYSSSETFLAAVHPSLAAISVSADNSYGHPTPEVLQRLQKFGITTLITDQYGDIKLVSDGNNINIK